MNDFECPYCGEWQEVNHDDGVGYEEDEKYQHVCSDCGKTCVYSTSISFDYYSEKADCLNDGEHDYQLTHTWPKSSSRMRCVMCDDERQPTKEEREKYELDKEV